MWDDPADGPAPFWRVAYHTLFYAHFYLQQKQDDFTPWARHRDEAQFMGSVPSENHGPPKPCRPSRAMTFSSTGTFVTMRSMAALIP